MFADIIFIFLSLSPCLPFKIIEVPLQPADILNNLDQEILDEAINKAGGYYTNNKRIPPELDNRPSPPLTTFEIQSLDSSNQKENLPGLPLQLLFSEGYDNDIPSSYNVESPGIFIKRSSDLPTTPVMPTPAKSQEEYRPLAQFSLRNEIRPLLQAYLQNLKRANDKESPHTALTLKQFIAVAKGGGGLRSMKRRMFWQPLGYVPQRDRLAGGGGGGIETGGSAGGVFRYGK